MVSRRRPSATSRRRWPCGRITRGSISIVANALNECGRSGRRHRGLSALSCPGPAVRHGPRQPRHRPGGEGPAGRGHRRVPRGPPAQGGPPPAHDALGNALTDKGRLDEAIAEYREAIRLKKDLPQGPRQPRQRPVGQGPAGRGHRRIPRGHPTQAGPPPRPTTTSATPCRTRAGWTRPSPSSARPSDSSRTTPRPTTTSATPCEAQGRLDEAIAEYREAIRAQEGPRRGPQQPRPRPAGQGPGWTKPSPSTARPSASRRIYAEAHVNLGNALQQTGRVPRGPGGTAPRPRTGVQEPDAGATPRPSGCGSANAGGA